MTREPKPITRARSLRVTSTDAERLLWKLLRDRRLTDAKFRRQHPIGPFVVDFACVSHHLVVELDGLTHTLDEQRAFDAKRTAYLEFEGWRVLRITDKEMKSDASGALQRIAAALDQA